MESVTYKIAELSNVQPSRDILLESLSNDVNALLFVKKKLGDEMFDFFNEIGVFQLENIHIILSKNLLFHDFEKMNSSELIINLVPFNKMAGKQIFMNHIQRNIRNWSYYIGCFSNSYNLFPLWDVNNYQLTLEKVSNLFRLSGFEMILHKSISGKTYFMARQCGIVISK